MVDFGQVVVIGQKWLYSGKVIVFGPNGYIRAKVVIFGNMVVLRQTRCIQARWLY